MRWRAIRAGVILAGVVLAGAPAAAATDCPALFADGQPPVLVDQRLAAQTIPLCFAAFAVLHSGVSRTPLYAAEHLTRQSVAEARGVARDDSFHEERAVPEGQRADLDDYVHSGFDRGHLAPAGDMPTEAAQAQSFSLANVVPQDRSMNRGLWADIEEATRRLASRRGSLYAVTGVIFSGATVQRIKGRVLVPTQLFKALYDPATGEAGAYLVQNADGRDWRAVSIAELQAESGIDAFPGLPAGARASAMRLPDPHASSRGDEARARRESTWGDWLGRELARAGRKVLRDLLRALF